MFNLIIDPERESLRNTTKINYSQVIKVPSCDKLNNFCKIIRQSEMNLPLFTLNNNLDCNNKLRLWPHAYLLDSVSLISAKFGGTTFFFFITKIPMVSVVFTDRSVITD